MKQNKSFTLIEILVVIVIIGILSGFIIVSLAGTSAKASIAKSQAFATSLKNALMLNLVSEWRMDEGSGATISDQWGSYPGTLTGGDWKTGVECISGSCLYFSGDDYINTGLGFSLPNYVEKYGMSLAAWIKTSSATTQSVVSQDSNSGCTYSCAGGLYIMNNKAAAIVYDGIVDYQYIYSTSTANDNRWHYLVASFNNDHKVRIYFDGKEENSQTLTDYYTVNAIGITIGYLKELNRNYNHVVGYIDEVRVFSEAVSEARVRADYLARLNELLAKEEIALNDYLSRVMELKT